MIIAKKILYGFGFIMLGGWLYTAYLYNSFVNYPTSPNEAVGLTIPFAARNQIVYISDAELRNYNLCFYGSISGLLIYAILYTIIRKRFGEVGS